MAVTVTVYVCGIGGPELPPPHAADIVDIAMASTESNHNPRRFLDEFLAAISPKTAKGGTNAQVPAANVCELDDGARLDVINAALIVSVAVPKPHIAPRYLRLARRWLLHLGGLRAPASHNPWLGVPHTATNQGSHAVTEQSTYRLNRNGLWLRRCGWPSELLRGGTVAVNR